MDRRAEPGLKAASRQRFVRCASPRGLHRVAYLEWGDPKNERVLVCVHGLTRCAQSNLLTKDTCAQMTQRGPKAKVVEIPDVGHAPTLMHEDQIRIVRDFLLP